MRRMAPVTTKLLNAYTREELIAMPEAEKIKAYQRLVKAEGGKVDDDEFAFINSMGVGMEDDEISEEEDSSDDEKVGADNKKKLAPGERLTQADRNKKLRLRMEAEEAAEAKRLKEMNKAVGQVGTLIKDLKKEEAEKKKQRDEEAKLKLDTLENFEKKGIVKKGTKIGRNRFEENGTNFLEDTLPDKAEGGLRQTKVASALMDRMKSVYRRNMCELPPQLTSETVVRMKKRARKESRNHKTKERSLLLA